MQRFKKIVLQNVKEEHGGYLNSPDNLQAAPLVH